MHLPHELCAALYGSLAGLALATLLLSAGSPVSGLYAAPSTTSTRVVTPAGLGVPQTPRAMPYRAVRVPMGLGFESADRSKEQAPAQQSPALGWAAAAALVAAGAAWAVRRRTPAAEERPWVMAAAGKGFGPAPKTPPKAKAVKLEKADEPCPCGSGKGYGECCQPFHLGKETASSPLELLKTRYSAFANKKRDYIRLTTDDEHMKLQNWTVNQFIDNVTLSCNNLAYEKLVIVKEEPGETEDEAWITFRIWFKFTAEFSGTQKGVTRRATEFGDRQTRTERSLFRKKDGKWWFVDSPAEFTSSESFELGDASEVQTNVLLKAKDAATAVTAKAAEVLLPKKDIKIQE